MFNSQEREYIIKYKYHGGDSSPIYKYLLSPLAENCVHYFIPVWMAPNVITFLGLMFSFLAFGVTMVYNPTLAIGAPRWLHLLTGICVFCYQTLDNMDGKQARKTGSSSALGMFFDHACDSINAGVTVIAVGSVMGTGWSALLFMCYGCTFIPFFFQTWEECYTGSMLLPPFNGPTEGLLMSITISFIAYFFGSETFHSRLFDLPVDFLPSQNDYIKLFDYPCKESNEITVYRISLLIATAATFPTCTLHIIRVVNHLLRENKSIGEVIAAITNTLPFLVYFVCMIIYVLNSTIAYPKFAILTTLMYCSSFAQLVMYIMVCHILHKSLSCYYHVTIWMTVLLSLYLKYGSLLIEDPVVFLQGETALLLIFAFYSIVSMISYFEAVCVEFAEVLNIHVFQLGKRHES